MLGLVRSYFAEHGTNFDRIEQVFGCVLACIDVSQWLHPEGFRSLLALIGTNGAGIGTRCGVE